MSDELEEKRSKKKEDLKLPSRKISVWRQTHPAPVGIVENTYQLQPPRTFKAGRAIPILQNVLYEALVDKEYSATDTRQMVKQLAQMIKARMMFLAFKRYKIVVHLAIGQMTMNPGVFVASRCLWNSEVDNYASASFENNQLFATAVVYFLNFE